MLMSCRIDAPNVIYGTVGEWIGSLRLDAGELDHFAPFPSFICYELAKLGGRAGEHRAAQIGNPRLHLGVGESGVDFPVELLNYFDGRAARRAEDERLAFEFLFDDPCVVAAGAQSPWARRRRIALAELVNEPWVLPPRDSGIVGPVATEAFGAHGLDYPRTTVVTDSPQVRTSLLATGRFLTIFPAYALRFPTERPELRVLPVELPMTRVPVGIITLTNRTLSPVARLFIEDARAVAKSLAKRK